MQQRAFRFAVMAAPYGDGAAWLTTARRVEELGYSTLLTPDGPQLHEPLLALSSVAAATTLRVGTFVLAAPLRPPASLAWQAHSLTELTGGRFDFGIGTGLPNLEQTVREFGLPFGSPGDRLASVGQTIDRLRVLDGGTPAEEGVARGGGGSGRHTPVLMAAGGPKARALAGAKADIVTLAVSPLASRDEISALVADVHAHAPDPASPPELATNLFVIGDDVPPEIGGFVGASARQLIEADSLAMLRGSVTQMCDELQRRRERFGASYVLVNVAFVEQFAPVLERLAGR